LRFVYGFARVLFIICLPALFLSAGIAIAVNSHWFYHYGFEKYGISARTGIEMAELDKAARGLIDYFNSAEEYIDISVTKDGDSFTLFNEREVLHLKDVKDLFRLDYRILLFTAIYALAFAGLSLWKKGWRYLVWGAVGGSGLTLLIMLLLGLGMVLDFDGLFLLFHLVSFSNEFWMLDPSSDYLIMLFPQGFWLDAALLCAVLTAGLAGVTGGVAGGMLFSRRHD
jgi:integral membrane protein (TIGR01906 family)